MIGRSFQELREALRASIRALHANRMRSLLTMLGIIIGVGAVITMIALGQGAKRAAGDSAGDDALQIHGLPRVPEHGLARSPRDL